MTENPAGHGQLRVIMPPVLRMLRINAGSWSMVATTVCQVMTLRNAWGFGQEGSGCRAVAHLRSRVERPVGNLGSFSRGDPVLGTSQREQDLAQSSRDRARVSNNAAGYVFNFLDTDGEALQVWLGLTLIVGLGLLVLMGAGHTAWGDAFFWTPPLEPANETDRARGKSA